MDTPDKIHQTNSENNESITKVLILHFFWLSADAWDLPDTIVFPQVTPLFSIEDDSFADAYESQTKYDPDLAMEIPNLLSVNQLLESVCWLSHALLFVSTALMSTNVKDIQSENGFLTQVLETAHQVGRISVANGSDVPYVEMARHCEALLMGKHQRMSSLMIAQQRQGSRKNLQNHEPEVKKMASYPLIDVDSNVVHSSSRKLKMSSSCVIYGLTRCTYISIHDKAMLYAYTDLVSYLHRHVHT